MKKYRFLKLLFISLTLFSLLSLKSSTLGVNYIQKQEFSRIIAKKSYSPQNSLILYQINSSSDWETIPGILGTGSENNPYIIKDIDHYDDIPFLYARNSEAFVIIENSTFVSWHVYGYNDLNFIGCRNVEINNCTFDSSCESIYFSNSSQFTIKNSFFKNIFTQIRLVSCNNFEISTNLFKNSEINAISLENCMDSCIYSNMIKGGSFGQYSGELIIENSQNITVRDNEIQDCRKAGIIIDLAINITISNNIIAHPSSYYNITVGIAQFRAKYCIIDENHIYNMKKDGILLQECENITVYRNILNNNSQNGISIINSSIINILQNTIVNNSNYGLFSNLSTYLNLEENKISNNQNGDIVIIKIPFYQKYWFIIMSTIGLVGIEFLILIKKNSQKNYKTDKITKKYLKYKKHMT
ncbi:MAG: right-handed parallel beta-helix repeat-containing protein [Promethearchaeota archaeon]